MSYTATILSAGRKMTEAEQREALILLAARPILNARPVNQWGQLGVRVTLNGGHRYFWTLGTVTCLLQVEVDEEGNTVPR
jgi:hypothetical protein